MDLVIATSINQDWRNFDRGSGPDCRLGLKSRPNAGSGTGSVWGPDSWPKGEGHWDWSPWLKVGTGHKTVDPTRVSDRGCVLRWDLDLTFQ